MYDVKGSGGIPVGRLCLEGMKAIPLFACLALAAVQVRAQTAPPADAAAPSLALGARAKLYRDIKSFRADQPALPSGFERRLSDIEKSVGESQTADALAKNELDFKTLQEELTATAGTTSVSPDSLASNRLMLQDFGTFTIRTLTGARTDSPRYFDFTGRSSGGGAGILSSGASAKDRPAFSFINASASPLGLHTNPLPALADGSSLTAYFREWVNRNGITPLDFNHLTAAASAPADPPPAGKPVMPSGNKPSSLAALEAWVDRTGVSDDVIAKLKTIKVVGGELLEGFGGYCYWGVKWMLTMVLPGVKNPKDLDLPVGNAYKLQLALKNDPKLAERLHLLPLDLKTVSLDDAGALPERTLLIWDRGCAGFSALSGHVEFTLHADKMKQLDANAFYPLSRKYGFWVPNLDSKTQVLACSDGCEIHAMQKLRAYAGKCLTAYVPVIAAEN